MATIIRPGESIEDALFRFKRYCERNGIKNECARRVAFKSNNQRRRDKERRRRQHKRA